MPENNVIVEEEVKYYVFVKEGRRHYEPQYIAAGPTSVRKIGVNFDFFLRKDYFIVL